MPTKLIDSYKQYKEVDYSKVFALEKAFDALQDVEDLIRFPEASQVREHINQAMNAAERAMAKLEG